MRRIILISGLLVLALPSPVAAQGARSAESRDSVMWYRVEYAKFKPGTADEARRIIYEHFWPVDREIGREVIPFDHLTGDWDHVAYFPLPTGPGEFAVTETPLGRRWNEVLARREGGQENAAAILRRFNELVLRTKSELVTRRIR
jgi:hypothetical protein